MSGWYHDEVDTPYANLGAAVEYIHDRLLETESRNIYELFAMVDKAAPGPDPLQPHYIVASSETLEAVAEDSYLESPQTRMAPLIPENDRHLIDIDCNIPVEAHDSDDETMADDGDASADSIPSKAGPSRQKTSVPSKAGPSRRRKRKGLHVGSSSNAEPAEPDRFQYDHHSDGEKDLGESNIVFKHGIDWENAPPKWDGRFIPKMRAKDIHGWLVKTYNIPTAGVNVRCRWNDCEKIVGAVSLERHIQNTQHIHYVQLCRLCNTSSRPDMFKGRHTPKKCKSKREQAEYMKRTEEGANMKSTEEGRQAKKAKRSADVTAEVEEASSTSKEGKEVARR